MLISRLLPSPVTRKVSSLPSSYTTRTTNSVSGRVLVLVPTLDLLTQTVQAWRGVGHSGPAVAVCSLQDSGRRGCGFSRCPGLRAATRQVSSIPGPGAPLLALWHGQGPVTIFGTYASLGVLAEAFEGAYGQQLAPMDLTVVDEAHRTSGSMGKAWADVHHQGAIPSHRRLYLTATPRIWQERPTGWEVAAGALDPLPEMMAASMDDEEIFGPVLYKLSLASAVSRGLLARYQIIVLELKDPVVTPERLMGEDRHTEESAVRDSEPCRPRSCTPWPSTGCRPASPSTTAR
ncbi:hypothetical protein SAMN05216482_0134 [Streptomyces sp. PAN_FS17]|nr:hypothetical protein SAMN05216482_0134 [Streptomyces sp. PAN_FS17]